jgi:hypothetical protein
MAGFGITFTVGCFLAMGGPARDPVVLPDMEVQTSSGPVFFHNVAVQREHGLRVNGVLTNRTDRRWTVIVLDLELLDASGKVMGRLPLTYKNLQPDKSRELANSLGGEPIQLVDPARRDFTGYRILYRAGEIGMTYMFTMLKPERNRVLQYEDQNAAFSFKISDTCIKLKLKNNLSSPLKVEWNAATFVDVFEQSHPVTHQSAGDSVVNPFATLQESITPVAVPPAKDSAIEIYNREGWRTGRILPRTQDAGELKRRTISLSLPFQIGGQETNYQFVFQVAETLIQ